MSSQQKLDTVLYSVVGVLLVAVLGLGVYFGYSVYRDRKAAENSTPALRVVNQMREAVKKSPNDSVLRVRLGEALAAAGDAQGAIEQLNAALKIEPKHTGAYLDLGLLAVSRSRPSEAKNYFEKVIDLTEGSDYEAINQRREVALYNLGVIALSEQEYEQAIGHFKAALRIRKDASDTYFYLARALDQSGETDEAMQTLENSLAFDPNFAQANYFMGELYLRKGDKVNASYHLAKAAKVAPEAKEPARELKKLGTSDEWIKRAQQSLKAEDLDAALDAALIATNLDPESFVAQKTHAEVILAKGNKKEALEVYRKAAKLDPDDAEVKAAIKKLSKSKNKKKS
ncbi:MAG: tetratricopeptide repeat protein [Coriobacteriales bacterium]|nr:tetratricopeptide repeat protein [Coriobacteriales bacterium]